MKDNRLNIAICGGGISGLTLAVALSRNAAVDVTLYETRSRFEEIGAGVMIWSRTWRILELMGLAPKFYERAHPTPDGSAGVGFDFRRSDQDAEGHRFLCVKMPYGCIRFHRASFLEPLVDALPEGVAQFGKHLLSYSQEGPRGAVTLRFSDGSTAVHDALVGCDGLKSGIRAEMFRAEAARQNKPSLLDFIRPVWTGTIAYRGLIPVNEVPHADDGSQHRTIDTPMMYCGKNKHVVSYSISQGSVVNVVTFASQPEKNGTLVEEPWVTQCPQQELLDCYSGWEPEVVTLLKKIEQPSRWVIHHLRPLPLYAVDRVVLIGDAAHAMAPHQGAGAGQAIEDAYVLAQLLKEASCETLEFALQAYQDVRLPRANAVLQGSYDSGVMYEFNSEFGELYADLGPAIEKQWAWIDETTPEEICHQALKCFQEKVAGLV